MNNQNPQQQASSTESIHELCQRFGVECRIVSEVAGVEYDGKPVTELDRQKWMVTAPAGQFPAALLPKIPLADTEHESRSLAVKFLMLRDRDYMLGFGSAQNGMPGKGCPAIPTPVYLAFVYDPSYWPSNDGELVYAADAVIEVDGNTWEQQDIEPDTFNGVSEVRIVAGDMFNDMTPMHSLLQHFYAWITGHQPDPQEAGEVA